VVVEVTVVTFLFEVFEPKTLCNSVEDSGPEETVSGRLSGELFMTYI